MTQRLTTRSIKTATAIKNREEFYTSGSLEGRVVDFSFTHGYLRGDDLDRHMEDAPKIKYVVFSYFTPIAWWTEERGWYKVKAKFSPTTTKHQGNLYMIEEG